VRVVSSGERVLGLTYAAPAGASASASAPASASASAPAATFADFSEAAASAAGGRAARVARGGDASARGSPAARAARALAAAGGRVTGIALDRDVRWTTPLALAPGGTYARWVPSTVDIVPQARPPADAPPLALLDCARRGRALFGESAATTARFLVGGRAALQDFDLVDVLPRARRRAARGRRTAEEALTDALARWAAAGGAGGARRRCSSTGAAGAGDVGTRAGRLAAARAAGGATSAPPGHRADAGADGDGDGGPPAPAMRVHVRRPSMITWTAGGVPGAGQPADGGSAPPPPPPPPPPPAALRRGSSFSRRGEASASAASASASSAAAPAPMSAALRFAREVRAACAHPSLLWYLGRVRWEAVDAATGQPLAGGPAASVAAGGAATDASAAVSSEWGGGLGARELVESAADALMTGGRRRGMRAFAYWFEPALARGAGAGAATGAGAGAPAPLTQVLCRAAVDELAGVAPAGTYALPFVPGMRLECRRLGGAWALADVVYADRFYLQVRVARPLPRDRDRAAAKPREAPVFGRRPPLRVCWKLDNGDMPPVQTTPLPSPRAGAGGDDAAAADSGLSPLEGRMLAAAEAAADAAAGVAPARGASASYPRIGDTGIETLPHTQWQFSVARCGHFCTAAAAAAAAAAAVAAQDAAAAEAGGAGAAPAPAAAAAATDGGGGGGGSGAGGHAAV
jgi:hypothetical protein